jgi:hypothetical protein
MATDAATLLVLVEAAEARAAAAEAALIAVQPAPSPLLAAPINTGARRAAARADSAPAGEVVEGGGGGGDDAEDASLLSVPPVERLRDESTFVLLPPAPTKWALFAFLLLLLAAPLGGDGGGGAPAAPRVEDDPAYAGFFTEAGADPVHCLGAGGWPAAPAAPGVGRLFVANPVPPGYGIGNQVFMLAAVVAYALEFNRCVVLPATDLHPSSSRAHGYDATVFRHFWIQRQLVDNKTAYAAAFEDEAAHVVQPGLSMHYAPFPRPAPRPSPPPPGSGGASDPAPSLAPPPRPPPWMAVLRGGFQHFSYTWAHRDTMRAYFRPHPAVARELLAKYPGLRRGVALHFRRGDYTNGGLPPAALRDFPIPSDFFYVHSVHLATRDEAGAPRVDPPREYFVFTNDYGWARNQTWVKRLPGKITFVEDEDEVYSWYMMMLAGEAVVCANSTFCWWAAYLGAAKRVYLPAHWYNSPGNEPTGIHWPGATVVQSDNEEGEGPPPWYPTPWNSRRAIEGDGHPLFD